jgi:hypothetical protein
MSASQSPASLTSNVEPKKQTSTQRKLVLGRKEFQAMLAALYLLQEHRDRLTEKESGQNYIPIFGESLERAPWFHKKDPGLDQLRSQGADATVFEQGPISQKTYWRTATLGTLLLVAIIDLGVSFHRFSPLGRLAADGGNQVPGKQGSVVGATKMLSRVEDQIRADRRLQGTSIHVGDSDGIFTLSGYVNNSAQRIAAVEDAREKGVRVVVDNLRVIDPHNQSALAVQDPLGSIGPRPKAPQEAFHVGMPPQRARPPAVSTTIFKPASTHTASHRDAAPSLSLTPKRAVPDWVTPAGSASVSKSAPPSMAPSMGLRQQVTVPEGTELAVQLTESLSSDHNQAGDNFHARLASPVVMGNKIVIPAEAIVQGRIVDARTAGHFHGDGALAVEVTRLTYNGKTYALRSSPYFKQGRSQTSRVAVTLGTGASVGAIVGAIVGGGKGAAIGAAIGAGAGSGIQAASNAAQVQLPAKTMLRFRLQTPITVIPSSTALKVSASRRRTVDHRVAAG